MPSTLYQEFVSHLPDSPSDSQGDFIVRFERFLLRKEKKSAFILRGYAGTGKTAAIAALVKSLPLLNWRTVLLAPTGRAAKVVSKNSKKSAFTIHKKIYFTKRDASGKFMMHRADNRHKDTLFIIDESSMISGRNYNEYSNHSSSLIDDLIQYVYSGENCRAVFVGDIAQLPPIDLDISPALDPQFLKSNYNIGLNGCVMKDVLRQKRRSGILHNATILREQLEQDEFKIQLRTKFFEDVKNISGLDLEDHLENSISKYGLNEVKIICRSNKSANAYNQQFRVRILGLEDEITTADQIMVVKNNYYWLDDSDHIGFIANGDIASIERITNVQELYGFKFADAHLRFIDYPDAIPVEAKILLNTLNEDHASLSMEKSQSLFKAVMEDYMHIKSKKERLEMIKKDPYYNALQVKFAYALTCHKAQGGQWKSVFVDQGYLTEELVDLNYLRWLYTAVTRAEERLFFVNFHPNFTEVET